MIAFKSGRRTRFKQAAARNVVEALNGSGGAEALGSAVRAAASRRSSSGVEIVPHADGRIERVRIGRWREIAAAENRRIVEVRHVGRRRVAVRIERFVDAGPAPASEIWQLYELDGRLEASMHSTPDGKFAMLSNYRTRQACRMMDNGRGELMPVETWKI